MFPFCWLLLNGVPCWTPTSDFKLRRLALCASELRGHVLVKKTEPPRRGSCRLSRLRRGTGPPQSRPCFGLPPCSPGESGPSAGPLAWWLPCGRWRRPRTLPRFHYLSLQRIPLSFPTYLRPRGALSLRGSGTSRHPRVAIAYSAEKGCPLAGGFCATKHSRRAGRLSIALRPQIATGPRKSKSS